LKQIRKRLTYANVMSTLAVFLILGGATALAASKKIGANQIKANSIKTGKIVKEAVTAGKIKTGAITESRLADGAVTTNKIADNAVTSPKIANDAVTTDKIANDAVTGDKVKESSLGQVPSAANADSLGGKAASEYSVRYFARVNGTAATPTLAAGSPGVTINSSRPFTGAATVHFPVDMTNCAIVATAFTGGTEIIARQSNISSANDVVIITETNAAAGSNQSFNVVGVC
jgi:hypothetical protein